MSQSWDNVANMHELFTVSSHTRRKSEQYHLPSCMSTAVARTLNLLLRGPHSSMQVNSAAAA